MKKKNKKNTIEKALELVGTLKANIEVLKEKGQDVEFIKTLDIAVRKLVRHEKEIVASKERLKTKKEAFKLEQVQTLGLVKDARKIVKSHPEIKKVKIQKEKKQPTEKGEETTQNLTV
jgi:hypothetical protein